MKENRRRNLISIGSAGLLFILLFIVGFYLCKNRYLACLRVDMGMCLNSKYYKSESGLFSFRYPKDYPLTHMTGVKLKSRYGSDFGNKEWVNFSTEFYPNAGGERLGSVIIKSTTHKDIKEYVEKELSNFEEPPKIEYTNIAGIESACSSLPQQLHSFTPPSYDCYLIYKGDLYWISFDYSAYYHKLPIQNYEKGRQIVLSTFKLI